MKLDEYQKLARSTAIYPNIDKKLVYPVLGLAGETGELVNKVKKIFRDDKGEVTEERKKEVSAELGDVLWYVAQIATELDVSLTDIAKYNLKKLQSRHNRGAITGAGDER